MSGTITAPEQGSVVTAIQIVPGAMVAGQATQATLTVSFDDGTTKTAQFALPAGAMGPRGTGIYFFDSEPTVASFPAARNGDLVINDADSSVWRFDGTNWNFTGSYLRAQKDKNQVTSVSINQNGVTTNYPAKDGGGIVKVATSQWPVDVVNPIVSIQSYYGYQGPNWKDAELARVGVRSLQTAVNAQLNRDKALNRRKTIILQEQLGATLGSLAQLFLPTT